MWYENSFRRHLADMHINDWHDGVFLAQFDPAAYVDNLKRAHVKSAMIYLQSHVGYCYFPTRVGHIHSAFAAHPGKMPALFDACRAAGIDTVIYYSLIYNTIEAQTHPDWLLFGSEDENRDFSGKRYLHCCPNSPDYRAFVQTQIEEMLSFVKSDGIFFDMPFWPKICNCAHCRARWEAEHGGSIPASADDPAWEAFVQARLTWLNEWIASVTRACRRIRPDISVEYNMAFAALPSSIFMDGEGINAQGDYAGGDLYKGMFTHSFACKLFYAMTPHQPFESMTSRCPNLKAHTLSRSRTQLRMALLTAAAHHGANLVIDAIDPAGTMNGAFYDELGTLFAEIERYEPYLQTGALAADAGVFFCQAGKGLTANTSAHYSGTLAASELLARLHIPHAVLTEGSIGDLSRFRTLILSGPERLSKESVRKIRAYLEAGGTVYFSGDAQEDLLAFIGEKTGTTPAAYSYMTPAAQEQPFWGDFSETYPLPVPQALPVIQTDGTVLATITLPFNGDHSFASIHSNPPGIKTNAPALVKKTVGAGTVLWSAAPLEAQPYERVRNVFLHYLRALIGRPQIETDAPEQVEAITFASANERLVSFVFLSDDQTVPTVAGFSVSVACPWKVRAVVDLTNDRALDFEQTDQRVSFRLNEFSLFAMIRIIKE